MFRKEGRKINKGSNERNKWTKRRKIDFQSSFSQQFTYWRSRLIVNKLISLDQERDQWMFLGLR